jgi:hypothetical protein
MLVAYRKRMDLCCAPGGQRVKSNHYFSRAVIVAGALMLIGGSLQVLGALTVAPDAEPFYDLLKGAAWVGTGLGTLGLELGWFEPTSASAPMSAGKFYATGFGLMLFIGSFILRRGMHQIGGYDHSILVDFGWRLYQGQKPYQDFPCTVPVAFPLGVKFAFQWFGVSWLSIIEMTALFSMATFVWSIFLLAQLFGRGWTALLWALSAQVFSNMLASFWWYCPITAVAAVLYMLSAMYWLRRPEDKFAMISYGASLLLMATMKANDAGVMIPGFSAILFASSRHRWKALGVSLVSFAFFLLLLSLNRFSFVGLLDAYWYISPRGASLVPFLLNLDDDEKRLALLEITCLVLPAVAAISQSHRGPRSFCAWIPVVAMVGAVAWFMTDTSLIWLAAAAITLPVVLALAPGRQVLRSPGPWIGVVALMGAIYGCLTDSEQKLIDLPPVFVAATLLVAELRSPSGDSKGTVFEMPIRWNRYFCLVCVVLGTLGLAEGYSRVRVRAIGPGRFFQFDDSKYTIRSGFFKGVHCGYVFYNVLNDCGELLRREPSATVFFGGSMEWAYAAFGKPSPTGEPVVWDRLTMFDKSRDELYFNHLLQSRYQVMIFFHGDLNDFVIGNEMARLLSQYKTDRSYRYLTVLRLDRSSTQTGPIQQ